MTPVDKLTIAGIAVTGVGSAVATVGVYLQMNGYFAFKARDFFEQILRIVRKLLLKGPSAARKQIDVAAQLAERSGEDRGKSLIGFYCVFLGFLLQMLGSALLIAALFANPGGGAGRTSG
jgi:hypothetical protein